MKIKKLGFPYIDRTGREFNVFELYEQGKPFTCIEGVTERLNLHCTKDKKMLHDRIPSVGDWDEEKWVEL